MLASRLSNMIGIYAELMIFNY